MDLDILCRVVDNFGDIGVAYRLARSLSELPDPPRLRLVVDDLRAFASLDPAIDPEATAQVVHGWDIFTWADPGAGVARAAFAARPATIVIECFACGRPDWLEELIFDPQAEGCFIVDLEHLSAEAYAEDFHRLPSLTRSWNVRKAIFLPGFSPGTGGLLLDRDFALARARARGGPDRAPLRSELLSLLGPSVRGAEERFWICVFGYERDYRRIVADIAAYGESVPLLVIAAAGKSQDCFVRAWEEAARPFPLLSPPFLPQEVWDTLLLACDFSIVRGEDSWSRAALSGRPFLWQAYPQEGRQQLVKVRAFLDRMAPHFATQGEAFSRIESLFLAFNDRDRDGAVIGGEEELLPALEAYSGLLLGFEAFSSSLSANPGLAPGLVTFLREIV